MLGKRRESTGKEGGEKKEGTKRILIDAAKQPMRSILKESGGWKLLARRFRSQYDFQSHRDEYTAAALEGVAAVVLGGPSVTFEAEEIKVLKEYMTAGGSVLVMAAEGNDDSSFQHLNTLTEDYGIKICNNSVARTVYYKGYYHPKEVFIKDVAIVRSLDVLSGKTQASRNRFEEEADPWDEDRLKIVYPFGCTLQVRSPALPMLTSGFLSFPQNQPLCAAAAVGQGKLLVLGSVQVWEDGYLAKEDNALLATALFRYMTEEVENETVDPDRPEFAPIVQIPDTEALAERLRPCLQESEELPTDFTQMFDNRLFKYDTDLIPAAIDLFDKLNVKHQPLSLIRPTFEVPLPPLQPAVWMPMLRPLPPPALDLFDLDADFASEKLRLAQLTNKCNDDDLEYFIREAGEILGVSETIRADREGATGKSSGSFDPLDRKAGPVAKEILEYILVKLVNYKKIEQEGHLQFNATNDSTELAGMAGSPDGGIKMSNIESKRP